MYNLKNLPVSRLAEGLDSQSNIVEFMGLSLDLGYTKVNVELNKPITTTSTLKIPINLHIHLQHMQQFTDVNSKCHGF